MFQKIKSSKSTGSIITTDILQAVTSKGHIQES